MGRLARRAIMGGKVVDLPKDYSPPQWLSEHSQLLNLRDDAGHSFESSESRGHTEPPSSRSKVIRVGNLGYGLCYPYRLLQRLPWISYQENFATDNARKFQEGELDAALVPLTSCVSIPDCCGLDFGIALRGSFHGLRLVAHSPIQELKTIYVYHDSTASTLLLRLLLANKWNTQVRLVPTRQEFNSVRLGEGEGILLRDWPVHKDLGRFAVEEDLVKIWTELTGKPFVLLVWLVRLGAVGAERLLQLNEVLHRAAHAFSVSQLTAIQNPLPTNLLPDESRGYNRDLMPASLYLGPDEQEAIRHILYESYSEKILPEGEYRSATIRLLDRSPNRDLSYRSVNEILARIVEGDRLSIADALELCSSASIQDLQLANEMQNQAVTEAKPAVKAIALVGGSLSELERGVMALQRSLQRSETLRHKSAIPQENLKPRVLLIPDFAPDQQASYDRLERWESLIAYIRSTTNFEVGGFCPQTIMQASFVWGIEVRAILASLSAAGLSELLPFGGGMLVERVHRRKGQYNLRLSEWFKVIKWAHRYGLATSCCLTMSKNETWEERLYHLEKLRSLQDLNPGFGSLILSVQSDSLSVVQDSERVRAALITRLFMDNITRFITTQNFRFGLTSNTLPRQLSYPVQDLEVMLCPEYRHSSVFNELNYCFEHESPYQPDAQ